MNFKPKFRQSSSPNEMYEKIFLKININRWQNKILEVCLKIEKANLHVHQKYVNKFFLSKALKLCHLNLKHVRG